MRWGRFLFALAAVLLPILANLASPDIMILNPHSYPRVGGNWTVRFNTSGIADLSVTPVKGTSWDDLQLLGIYCGDELFEHEWQGETATVSNYECDAVGREVSRVLTPGEHHLEFGFGNATAGADNYAGSGGVQHGMVTGSGTRIIDQISQVNQSRAFILFTANTNDATPDDNSFTPEFINDSYLAFDRYDGATTSSTIAWQVAENEDFLVQRGERALLTTDYDLNVSISSVNTSSTFVIVYGSCADETTADNYGTFFAGRLTNSTNLWLKRRDASLCAANVSWQVVSWEGAIVQSGESEILDNEADTDANINEINQSRTILVFSFSADGGSDNGMDSNLIQGNISSPTTLHFTHNPGTTLANSRRVIDWYVIEVPGGRAQSGFQALSTAATFTAPIQQVNMSRSFHLASGWNTGGGNTYSNSLFTGNLTNSTAIDFTKQTTGQTQNIVWFLIEMPERDKPPLIYGPRFNASEVWNDEVVLFQVNVTDDSGSNVTSVNVTFRYPNATEVNRSLTPAGYPVWETDWTDTIKPGRYNVTHVYASDNTTTTHEGYSVVSFKSNDSEPSQWSLNSTNATLAGWAVEHRVYWEDQSGLSGYVFSWHNGVNWTSTNGTDDLEAGEVQYKAGCFPDCPTSVQGESGMTTLSAGQTQALVRLDNTYNLSKAFLVGRHHGAATPTTSDVNPNVHTGTVRFVNSSYIEVDRYDGTTYDSRATWSVLQADNIRVWNFTNSWASGDMDDDVVLSPALPSDYADRCFVELARNTRVDSTNLECYAAGQVVSNITSTISLNLRRSTESANCPTAPDAETVGYVVCFLDDTVVQTRELTGTFATETSDTITPVNRSNAWLTFDFMVNNNGLQQVSIRGNLTADNQVSFYKGTGTGTATVRYYVIEFEGGKGGFVETRGGSVAYSVTQQDWDFGRSYSENDTLAVCSESYESGTGTAFPRVWWTAYWLDEDTIRQDRGRVGTTSQSSDHVCQAVEWPAYTTYATIKSEDDPTDWNGYENVLDNDFVRVTSVNVTVDVIYYQNTGSSQRGNANPDLQLQLYNGTGWVAAGNFSVSSTGNFSLGSFEPSVLSGWSTKGNRDIRIRGVSFDFINKSYQDRINFTGVWVEAASTSEFVNDSWVPLSGDTAWVNVTKVINSTVGTTILWKVFLNDSNNIWDSTDGFYYTTKEDTGGPFWSGNQSKYPGTYNTGLSEFNVTWQDDLLDVDTVFIELNFSGSPVNYTTWQDGNLYGYNVSLPAGTHYWRSLANDSLGHWNVTDTWTFTVARADPAVNMLLNGTDGNFSAQYYEDVDLSVELGITDVVELWIDGGMDGSGVAPLSAQRSFSTLGPHNITGSYGGNQNYTSATEIHWLKIWGWSGVEWISPVGQKGTPGDLVDLVCNVSDYVTGLPVSGYSVDFWVDGSHLGADSSNSSGLASYTWDTAGYPPGARNVKCNITDSATLYYNDSATNYGSSTFTLVTLGTPTLTVVSPDLLIGKGNSNDNATVSCSVLCPGGNCDGLQMGLQYQNSSGWFWISDKQLVINTTNPQSCGTASSCNYTWGIEGLANNSFPIRCNASATFPASSKVNLGSNQIEIFVGILSIESWTPASSPLDVSIFDTFQIDPVIRCTAPANTKAGCGPLTMVARTNQTGSSAADQISASTNLRLQSGSAWQTYGSEYPASDGGYYEAPFSAIIVNMTVGGNGDTRLYDVKVNSSDTDVVQVDPADREVRGHTGQLTVAVYDTSTSNDKQFELKYNISCSGYRCIDVSVWPRYNASSTSADTLAPTSPSPEAYNVSKQPYLTLNLSAGQSLVERIVYAWSSASTGLWRIDLQANSTYSETTQVDAADADLEITEIAINGTLSTLSPGSILEGDNSTASGYCSCTGGTCSNTYIYVQRYVTTWMNIPAASSGYLRTNATSYSIGDLSGDSSTYSFNITGLKGGDYPVRVYCSSDEDSEGSSSLTLHVNDYPGFSDFNVSSSVVYLGQQAKFSVDLQDEAGIAWANFTIEGTNYSAVQGTGDQWYYLWTCSASNPSVDWTFAEANDTEGYYNYTTAGVSTECDAEPPVIGGAKINDSSIVNIGTVVKVNASVLDPEGNLDTVLIEVDRPVSGDYNQTPSTSGDEYYYEFLLDEEGLWRFRFYANDTGNQVNSTLARDGHDNQFINAMDIEDPSVSDVRVNTTLSKEQVKLNASVTDNVAVDTVLFTVNGTNYTQTSSSGSDWYYLWTCSESNSYSFTAVWANDSSGNWDWNTSVGLGFSCDLQAPSFTGSGQNTSTPDEGEPVKVYALWNGLYASLDTATLRTNESGIWLDRGYHQFSTKPEWSNFTIETSGMVNEYICWSIWANNSLGTLNDSMAQSCFRIQDVTPPTYSLEGDDSGGSVGEEEVVNVTAFWEDNLQLDYAVLRTYKGGSWSNESYLKFTATPQYSDFSINTTGYPAQDICWVVWANDTGGNWNTTMQQNCFYVQDVKPPTYSQDGDDSGGSIEATGTVAVFALWDDDVALDSAILRTNKSGFWTTAGYHQFSTKPEWSNFTIDTTGYGGTMVCWTQWANDTSGNWNSSMPLEAHCFNVADTVPPKWSDNSTGPEVADAAVEHMVLWKDGGGLSNYVFSFDNCTGTMVNDSSVSLPGTSGWVNVTKHTNSTIGCTIRWKVYVQDSGGNWNGTDTFAYPTLENLAPKWSLNSTNATLAGWTVRHSLLWHDDTGLSGYVFAFHNGSNLTWTNDSADLEAGEVNYSAEGKVADSRHVVYHEQFDFTSGLGTSTYRSIGGTVNTTNAFLMVYTAAASSSPDNWMVTGYIYNSTHILFERGASSDTAYVSWFVVERLYDPSIEGIFTTQRGSITISSGSSSNVAAIAPVNVSRSIVIGQCRVPSGAGTGDSQDGYATFELVNSTYVMVRRASTATGVAATCRFEVVEFSQSSGVNVQTGETTLSSTNPVDADITPFNSSSSWLYHSWDATDNGLQQVSVYGQMLDDDTIRFGRYSSTSYTNRIRWYLVEYPRDAEAIADNYNWDPPAAGTNDRDNAISQAVNRSRTIIIHSSSTSGTGTSFARNKNLPYFVDISVPGDNWRETQYYGATANYDQHETRAQIVTLPNYGGKNEDNEANSSYTEYQDVVEGELYEWVRNLTVTVSVSYYNGSGSTRNGNTDPDLWLDCYNGTVWVPVGAFGATGTGNFSIEVQDADLKGAWVNPSSRDLRLRTVYLDYNDSSDYDRIGYDGVWVNVNSEREFVNDSWKPLSGNAGWSNVTKVVNSTTGTTIKWRMYANDTIDNWNSTGVFTYQTQEDTQPPWWSGNSTNDTAVGQAVLHSVLWQDDVGLSGYVFSFDNCTGTMVNDSWKPIYGASAWVNVSKTISGTPFCTIRWKVYANDSWGGLWNTTDTFQYQTELKSDLRVGRIMVNNTSPKEGELVLIQVNVSNAGPSGANSTRVWFNETDSNGLQTGHGEATVSLGVRKWMWVNLTTSFGQGTHVLNVSAFTAANVTEVAWDNNWNSTNVTVPVWVYFHGNVTGELVLAVSNVSRIHSWDPTSLEGNFFVTDYDAGVDFLNLKALNGTDDLHELDLALGTENYTDSVKNVYDVDGDGWADNTSSFLVYGVNITDVPVVNATDGSPWLVGILWDGDDGAAYTGAQDVVFVVKLKPGELGAFGRNDYEARAPSNLQKLMGSLNLIATRVEIR